VQGIAALNDYSVEVYDKMYVARLPHYIRDQCLSERNWLLGWSTPGAARQPLFQPAQPRTR